ncbi:unnamed protein product [Adineta ricciae]|uniref:G-protein coupled receptors family 1 profile domain-containing protein n=1 Tax=Adineta ricciae TaxID=249248 RepID=A0A813TKR9_ADIRI|nr:unnamed protein product [Adineta ricciae]CAF1028156.1 unnamed protein product [Adineta ricciae]
MLYQQNSSMKGPSPVEYQMSISRSAQFWIIFPIYIPSVVCSLFDLYHYLICRTIRQALHNHVITFLLLINLIIQLTSIPFTLSYLHLGYVWPQSPTFCIFWTIIDEGLFIALTAFFAWATIERHILIFHDRLVSTRRKIIIFHYIPMVIVFLYCVCYTLIVIVFPPCENTFDYDELTCGEPICYYNEKSLAMWDIIVDHLIAVLIIVFCSFTLLLRILYQKSRMRQTTQWKKYRKMTIQLLAISFLYFVIYIPHMFLEFLHICCIPEEVGADFMAYSDFFSYYGNLLLPFVCAGSIPDLRTKVKNMFLLRRRRVARIIYPETMTLSRRAVVRQ